MRMSRVNRILKAMSWIECTRLKEKVKWLNTGEAGIEYSRACKEAFANGVIWYADGYLPPMPPPLAPTYMEDFDR